MGAPEHAPKLVACAYRRLRHEDVANLEWRVSLEAELSRVCSIPDNRGA